MQCMGYMRGHAMHGLLSHPTFPLSTGQDWSFRRLATIPPQLQRQYMPLACLEVCVRVGRWGGDGWAGRRAGRGRAGVLEGGGGGGGGGRWSTKSESTSLGPLILLRMNACLPTRNGPQPKPSPSTTMSTANKAHELLKWLALWNAPCRSLRQVST
jgi:hypothetical protein